MDGTVKIWCQLWAPPFWQRGSMKGTEVTCLANKLADVLFFCFLLHDGERLRPSLWRKLYTESLSNCMKNKQPWSLGCKETTTRRRIVWKKNEGDRSAHTCDGDSDQILYEKKCSKIDDDLDSLFTVCALFFSRKHKHFLHGAMPCRTHVWHVWQIYLLAAISLFWEYFLNFLKYRHYQVVSPYRCICVCTTLLLPGLLESMFHWHFKNYACEDANFFDRGEVFFFVWP